MSLPEAITPALTGLLVAFATSGLLVATKRWHGALSVDSHSGPQKYHDAPTPRVGGIALLAGFLAAAAAAPPPIRELLLTIGLGSLAALVAGLAEDVTNRVPPSLRLGATLLAAWSFCLLSGYTVTRADAPFLDALLALPVLSITVTTVLLAGFAHATNIIDGFHGLAAGTAIIMLGALGYLAHLVGDTELAWTAAMLAAVLSGFLLVNFPFGRIFLGDGGAYLTGLMIGTVAIMLVARNPEASVWVVAVILAYPALETVFSIFRKSVRKGHGPFRADEMHMHHLLYRRLAIRLRTNTGRRRAAANPLTGALMWGWALTGCLFVAAFPHAGQQAILFLALQSALYLVAYSLLLASPRGHAPDDVPDPAFLPFEPQRRAWRGRATQAGTWRLGSHRGGHPD